MFRKYYDEDVLKMNDNSNQDNFDVDRISPTPITSQSSYSEAQSDLGNTQSQPYSAQSHKSIEIVIYIIIFISIITSISFSFLSFKNAKTNKSSSSAESTKDQIEQPLPQEAENNINKNKPTSLNDQSTDNTNSSYVAPVINKTWKEYTTDKYNLSFYYPSSLTLYKGNPADSYILYDIGLYPPKDLNDKIIKLRSSIGISINTKSRISDKSNKVTINTQSGPFNGTSNSGPYMDTGGTLYEIEFYHNGWYYYYRLFNLNYDERIMTTDEFKQLIESSAIE